MRCDIRSSLYALAASAPEAASALMLECKTGPRRHTGYAPNEQGATSLEVDLDALLAPYAEAVAQAA